MIEGKGKKYEGVTANVKLDVEVTRKLYSDKEDIVWASKGVVARVLNGENIFSVQQKIHDVSFENVRVLCGWGWRQCGSFLLWERRHVICLQGRILGSGRSATESGLPK